MKQQTASIEELRAELGSGLLAQLSAAEQAELGALNSRLQQLQADEMAAQQALMEAQVCTCVHSLDVPCPWLCERRCCACHLGMAVLQLWSRAEGNRRAKQCAQSESERPVLGNPGCYAGEDLTHKCAIGPRQCPEAGSALHAHVVSQHPSHNSEGAPEPWRDCAGRPCVLQSDLGPKHHKTWTQPCVHCSETGGIAAGQPCELHLKL